jgi:hypothetical protein
MNGCFRLLVHNIAASLVLAKYDVIMLASIVTVLHFTRACAVPFTLSHQ